MPLFSSKKKAAFITSAGVFSIKTAQDAIRWFENRHKAFAGTKAQVLQKWSDRKAGLPEKEYLKRSVRRGNVGNTILEDALTKGMQIDPQDKNVPVDVIKEMWPTSMLLADFGQCLQLLVAGTKFNMGPLKGHERMAEKVMDPLDKGGYDGDISQLNDAYRGTILCSDQSCYNELLALCDGVVTPFYGIYYHKQPKNKFKNPDEYLGYGDFTYYLNFREVAHTAELQINHLGILFGKTELKKWDYADIATYSSLESRYNIPGGLGHKYYEDYRKTTATPEEKEKAKKLSIEYYGICQRGKATPEESKKFWAEKRSRPQH